MEKWAVEEAKKQALAGKLDPAAPWDVVIADCKMKDDSLSNAVLGVLAEHGVGTPHSQPTALAYFKKAALGGNGFAAMQVFYQTSANPERVVWLIAAATNGVEDAKLMLGKAHRKGLFGLTTDLAEARNVLQTCALPQAKIQLARISTPKQAYQILKPLADSANLKACFRMYTLLVTCPSQFSQMEMSGVRNYLETAAFGGYPKAFGYMGKCYLAGNNFFEKNYTLSRYWYERGALEANSVRSVYRLGELHENGYGCEVCNWKAWVQYQKAADMNDMLAHTAIAKWYLSGKPNVLDEGKTALLANPVLAVEHLLKAQQIPEGCFLLGKCYLEGTGTPVSQELGVRCLELALAKGYGEAKVVLHNHYTKLASIFK